MQKPVSCPKDGPTSGNLTQSWNSTIPSSRRSNRRRDSPNPPPKKFGAGSNGTLIAM
ncbi:unnamed protein product [Linum tenue]|uniref:Uncharacterized protein n=1 Tax=Linum tenue TaxID=586396 RepID=A0AAV0HYE7_9ROSI|nr:unnamed protein product [Linum tenue]